MTVHVTGPAENANEMMKTTSATSVITPAELPRLPCVPDCQNAKPTTARLSAMPTRPAIRSGRRPRPSMKAMAIKVESTLTAPIPQVVAWACSAGVAKPAAAKMLLE